MTQLVVEIRSDPQALIDLQGDWNRLWEAQDRREIFGSHAWHLASWKASAGSLRLHLVIVRRGLSVVGLLPLAIDASRTRFLSGHHADYNDILVCDSDIAAVVGLALHGARRANAPCVLESIPDWSVLSQTLSKLNAGIRARIVVGPAQPCPALRLQPDRDSILGDIVAKKSLKRHEKKLQRLGPIKLRHIEDRGEIRALLPDFFLQHIARRAVSGERSLFQNEYSRSFYGELIELLNPRSDLRFSVLEVGSRAVAYHLGFEIDGRFTWYKPTFDVDLWDYGAGEVLIKRLLEYIWNRPIQEFDFTRGGEAFKSRFSNHVGYNRTWSLYSSFLPAKLAHVHSATTTRLKGSAFARRLRQHWTGFSGRLKPTSGFSRRRDDKIAFDLRGFDLSGALAIQSVGEGDSAVEVSTTANRASLRKIAEMTVASKFRAFPGSLDAARVRFTLGERLFLILQNEEVVGVAWINTAAPENQTGPSLVKNSELAVTVELHRFCHEAKISLLPPLFRAIEAQAPEKIEGLRLLVSPVDLQTIEELRNFGLSTPFRLNRSTAK